MEQVTSVAFFSQMRKPKYADRLRFFNEFEGIHVPSLLSVLI